MCACLPSMKYSNSVSSCDLPLSMVDNLTVKPLVRKMVEGGLDPETVNKYVRYVKQVVKSKLAPNGEPLYPRVWNSSVLDLPLVVYSKQKRPALKVEDVNVLIANAESDEERYLYVLLAATGMRISEALALETRHFINGGRTIVVEQQVEKDCPRMRFRNSWLRAPAQRCQEDLRKFWLAHKPKEMGELYSALKEDLPTRLAESERVGYGFVLPKEVVPNVPRKGLFVVSRKAPAKGILVKRITKAAGV